LARYLTLSGGIIILVVVLIGSRIIYFLIVLVFRYFGQNTPSIIRPSWEAVKTCINCFSTGQDRQCCCSMYIPVRARFNQKSRGGVLLMN